MIDRLVRLCAALIAAGVALCVGAPAYAQFGPAPAPQGWYGSADAVYAWRSVSSDNEPIIVPDAGSGSLYSGGDAKAGPRPGVDLRLGWNGPMWGLEGRYFGAFHWSGSSDLGTPGDFRIGDATETGVNDLTAGVSSRFDSGEFNATHALDSGVVLFAGARVIHFTDTFSADAFGPGPTDGHFSFRADTTGVGPQVGAQAKFSLLNSTGGELAYVNLDVRGGLLFERNQDTYSLTTNGVVSASAGANGTITSGVFEGGVTVGHRLGPYSLEAAYRLLYINRVPTGEGYAADSLANASESGPPVAKSLLIQAITLGVKRTF